MKKNLIIICVIGVLLLLGASLFFLNGSLSATLNDSKDDVIREPIVVTSEELTVAYNEILARYQEKFNSPSHKESGLLSFDAIDERLEKISYAFYDWNNDGIDELVINGDIYYYDGKEFQNLIVGYSADVSIIKYENGFGVSFYEGCCEYHERYYGNTTFPKDMKIVNWEDVGKILYYFNSYRIEENEIDDYVKCKKGTEEKKITEGEYKNYIKSLGKQIDMTKLDWKYIDGTTDFKSKNSEKMKYDATDYFYLTSTKMFVKGISLGGNTVKGNQSVARTTLAADHPKLFEVAKKVAYDMTFGVVTGQESLDIGSYLYPMYYQNQKTGDITFYFTGSDIYYDSDGDGLTDTKGQGYFVAPIDQYESEHGKLN